MTTFRLGQRVRLVRPLHPSNMGETGTICEFYPERQGLAMLVDCRVNWDDCYPQQGHHTSRLEPVTDSNTLVSWESMRDLWVPEHLREAA